MTWQQVLWRGLVFHWRMHLAVCLGTVVATAVICGALIIGDSVRASLRQLSLDRLAHVDHALSGHRVFREALAAELEKQLQPGMQVAPVLLMRGGLVISEPDDSGEIVTRGRTGGVQVYGIDERFWNLMQTANLTLPQADELIISRRVADQLRAAIGDRVSLLVEIPAAIPRDTLLGDREETVRELSLTISGIADEETTPARFSLSPSQQFPKNAFLSLAALQRGVGLQQTVLTPRNPVSQPARINALFVGHAPGSPGGDAQMTVDLSPARARELTTTLHNLLTLEDLALRIVKNSEQGYLSVESEQMILEDSLAELARESAERVALPVSPVLVYLLNEIWNLNDPEKYSMYSVAAGVEPELQPPFGPWEFIDSAPAEALAADEVIINDWLARDLAVAAGDVLGTRYHVVGDRGELPEAEQTFRVAGVVRLAGPLADAGLTPLVPGITDAESYANWREPFPLNRTRITQSDHDYWDQHRTTPKVFLSLHSAQALWRSRYGRLTSLRLDPAGQSLDEARIAVEGEFRSRLSPEVTGISFLPVKQQGLDAAEGTTNFSGLFIGFSFFLIVAAELLVSLMFRLGMERRATELGLLRAVGWTPERLMRLYLLESACVVGWGGVLGVLAGVGYATLMVYGLKTWWIGAIGTRHLFVVVHFGTLLIGVCLSVLAAMGVVWWALRGTQRISIRQLLGGKMESDVRRLPSNGKLKPFVWPLLVGGVSALLLLATLAGLVPDTEAFSGFSWRVVAFFVVGIGLLTVGIMLLSVWIDGDDVLPIHGRPSTATRRLGVRNAARHRHRSLMTTALIASATFVVVAVASGRKNPAMEAPVHNSGNGGFTLVAESSTPLLYDLNTPAGRAELQLGLAITPEERSLLESMFVAPFRIMPGDDASCLNLYQARRPTILGVPSEVLDEFDRAGRFQFANTPGEHPWRRLEDSPTDGSIPVLGDMNTLMYSLHKGVGEKIDLADPEATLQVAGMLSGSIFQGLLLMSEEHFLRLFPQQAGFGWFLIETDQARPLAELLERKLDQYGFDVERVADRLAEFLAVQNTYLLTFQTLGGMGLLLGTFGLATVMLRNVVERRGELSLLRAVGVSESQLTALVLWENALLTSWGLLTGLCSALLAMLPHLLSSGADVSWSQLLALLAGVFLLGMLSATAAVKEAVRGSMLEGLRGE